MYIKALKEKLVRVSAELQSIIDVAAKDNNRGLTSEEREKFNKAVEEHNALEDSIKLAEKSSDINAKLALPNAGPKVIEANLEEVQDTFRMSAYDKRLRAKDPHARAFSKFIRLGMDGLDPDEKRSMVFVGNGSGGSVIRAAQTTSPATGGGYLIPQGFSEMLEEAKLWFGGIEGTVGKFITETGNPWPWPTVNDTANKGRIIGQNVQVTETDFAFNQVTFNAYIGSSDIVLIPLSLMEDAYFDMDALAARLLGTRLGRLYNQQCTVGTGSSAPTGIITAAIAAGNVLTLATGNTASIAYANLVALEHSVDPAYRYNPSTYFMFSDAMLKLIKLLVDGQSRPLWQPGLAASFREGAGIQGLVATRPTILDHPYIINQDIAVPAANAYSAVFGDLNTFKVRELRSGTTVMRLVERYADFLQVGLTAFQRLDSNLIDAGTHPVAVLRQSAT